MVKLVMVINNIVILHSFEGDIYSYMFIANIFNIFFFFYISYNPLFKDSYPNFYKILKLFADIIEILNIIYFIYNIYLGLIIFKQWIVYMLPYGSGPWGSSDTGGSSGGPGGKGPTPGSNKGYYRNDSTKKDKKDPHFQPPSLQRSNDEGCRFRNYIVPPPGPPGGNWSWPIAPKPDLYGPDWELQNSPQDVKAPNVHLQKKWFFIKGKPKDGDIYLWGDYVPYPKNDLVNINGKIYTDDWVNTVTGKETAHREEYSRYWKFSGKSNKWEWQKISYKNHSISVSSFSGTKRSSDSISDISKKTPRYRY